MSTVQDDKPIAVEGASVSISVDEHFHHHGWFHFGFGKQWANFRTTIHAVNLYLRITLAMTMPHCFFIESLRKTQVLCGRR